MNGRIKRPETEAKVGLARIGMIKTGFKDSNNRPKSTDYFIPTGKYASFFTEAYGAKPNIIQIVFVDNDPGAVCNERYEYRDNDGRLFASGDGETFLVWNPKAGKAGNYEPYTLEEHPDLMERIKAKYPNRKGWEITLSLKFIIPKIPGIMGFWQFSTKGEASTIPAIRNVFDLVYQEKGFIRGIVFDLSVSFATSQKPGITSRYPVVNLIPNHSKQNLEMVKNTMFNPAKQIENG